VIDLHSRAIVGYAIADTMRTSLVTDALDMALAHRTPAAGVIFHSDRGTQGGFNWSSQHLDGGGVDGQAGGMDEGVDGQVGDEVSGGAVVAA
jgi:putative transposase